MQLVDLPLDVQVCVFKEVVQHLGVREVSPLRATCRLFDTMIQQAIFDLPTFESEWPTELGGISPHAEMPAVSMERLILAKLETGNAGQRPLTREILETTQHAVSFLQLDPSKKKECHNVLARAASYALSVQAVTRHLIPGKVEDIHEINLPLNTLICSMMLGVQDTTAPLTSIISAKHIQTRFFGSLLTAAVHNGHGMVQTMLQSIPRPAENMERWFQGFRLNEAISLASGLGEYEILGTLLHNSRHPVWMSSVFYHTTMQSLEYHDGSCARLLFNKALSLAPTLEFGDMGPGFLRAAVRSERYSLVEYVLERLPASTSMYFAVEEASVRDVSLQVLELLLRHCGDEGPSLYRNACYCAARLGHTDIFDKLLEFAPENRLDIAMDSVTGALVDGDGEVARHVLTQFGHGDQPLDFDNLAWTTTSVFDALVADERLLSLADEDQDGTVNNLYRAREKRDLQMHAYDFTIHPEQRFAAILSNCGHVRAAYQAIDKLPRSNLFALQQPIAGTAVQDVAMWPLLNGQRGLFMVLLYIKGYQPPVSGWTRHYSLSFIRIALDFGYDLCDPAWTLMFPHDIWHTLSIDSGGPTFVRARLRMTALEAISDEESKSGRLDTGTLPLIQAVKYGSFTTLQHLVKQGGDIHNKKLLHHLMGRFDSETRTIAAWLMDQGLSPNQSELIAGRHGRDNGIFQGCYSPMHISSACRYKDVSMTAFLMHYGGDPGIRTIKSGLSALDLAEEVGNPRVFAYLSPRSDVDTAEADESLIRRPSQ